MRSNGVRAAALAGALLAWVGARTTATYACPDPAGIIGGILNGSGHLAGGGGGAGCAPGCGPTDCGPVLGGSGTMTLNSGGLGGGSGLSGDLPFEIRAVDFTFLPNTPIIKPNTVVRWTNEGLFPHTTTRTGRWNSGVFNPNQFFDHTFAAADAGKAFDYFCGLHFGMEGVVNVAHFGDANLDGTVNLTDFNVLAANFGQSGRTWETGDFDENGTVNLGDFNLLAASFGQSIQPALAGISIDFGGAFVPEPGALALVVPAVVLVTRRRRSIH